MTSLNASSSTSAIPSAQDDDIPKASSSRHSSSANISVPVHNLVNRSSGSPSNNRKGKGKERAVDFVLEPNHVELEGGSEVNRDNDHEREFREDSDTEDEDEDEENYEAERQRRIRENQHILAQLGIEPSTSNSNTGGSNSNNRNGKSPPPGGTTSTRKRTNIPILDRSGYIISLPPEGQTQTMACIEIPSDRKLKKRIYEGEYTDCSYWQEGEARRWKFGFGKGGDIPEGEEEEVGGVTIYFRWRRWKGLERELRSEMRKRGELVEMDARPIEQFIPEGVSAYSLIPGESCHQCRRKSDKPKMKCRNVNPICRANFCETCCKRYSYFDFDEESRSFICPLCKDCCNCSNCIRKKNLAHLLGDQRGAFGKKSIKASMDAEGGGEMTVQSWLEKAVQDVSRAPFDLIRIVDQDKDIISPELPLDLPSIVEEDVEETIVVKKPRKLRARKRKIEEVVHPVIEVQPAEAEGVVVVDVEKPKAKRGRKKKNIDVENIIVQPPPDNTQIQPQESNSESKTNQGNLVIKLKIPKAVKIAPKAVPAERVKEVDSDGDTVGDWSDDEAKNASTNSSLTSISSLPSGSPRVPPRLPFPPQPNYAPIMNTNDYLSTLPGAIQQQSNSSPNTSNIDSIETALPVTPVKQDTPLILTPPQTNGEYYDSSHGGGADHNGTKKRRKPPPTANIVRAPRHSSISTSQSSPPGIHDEVEYNLPPILSIDNGGPRNLTGNQDMQLSAAPNPQFSITSAQYPNIDIGPPPLSNFTSSQIMGNSPDRSTHYWQSRSILEDNVRQQGYQTLYPSSSTYNNPNQQSSLITPTSSFTALSIPDYSTGYNRDTPSFPSLSMNQNLYSNPHHNSNYNYTNINSMSGGPPPYSHSPIRRSLVLSPNTERQYLTIDRSPETQTLPSMESIQNSHQKRSSNTPKLNHLDILSLAAAEVRHSPSEGTDGNRNR